MDLSAEELFVRYFRRQYPPEVDLARVRTIDANPGNNPHIVAQLDAIATTFAALAPDVLGAPGLVLDRSDASIHRLAPLLTRGLRDRLLTGDPPAIVHLVTHGAVYLGACVVASHGGRWLVRNPLWESRVALTSRAGVAELAPFQWWLKSLSDAEVEETPLADRYRLHVEVPTSAPEVLPVITPPRPLPRLKAPRYDSLVKYLQKHLPELPGVGAHFPTPDKLTRMAFHWLDFLLVGGGRMLVIHGPTDDGVHLFWLDASGFASAAYYPADALPPHRLEPRGDHLVLTLPVLGQEQDHEMLWWGPSTSAA
jgi:hypothetical protein